MSTGNISVQGRSETSVIIPFTTMQQNYNLGQKVQLLCYTAKKGYSISEVEEKVAQVVKRAHYIHPDDSQALVQVNAEAMFSMMDNLFSGGRILGWMVGLGTLLAGAIGVSNIMMVTVKERTTEIGIRRAIGARPDDILRQILSESMVLTVFAGMAGITLAVFLLNAVETGLSTPEAAAHFQISFGEAVGACLLLLCLNLSQLLLKTPKLQYQPSPRLGAIAAFTGFGFRGHLMNNALKRAQHEHRQLLICPEGSSLGARSCNLD